jgi:uncharacterized protein (DUF2336 family)
LGEGVALSAEDLGSIGRLANLAVSTPKNSRNDIYMAVVQLYRLQSDHLSERERALMRDILVRLMHDVEMAIRVSLAEKLADDPGAPLDLILLLADDAVEVARPLILRSHRLGDAEILAFLVDADTELQALCAQRPHIGEPVTAKLAQSDAEPVLVTLVRNATARIGASTFEALIEKSRHFASLQEPLAHRADLPAPLALRMCDWVSDALKSYIAKSGRLAPDVTEGLVVQAAQSITIKPPLDSLDSCQKLVDKLAVGGQLKAGFLLRVLQHGQIDLFDVAYAKLLELRLSVFRELFYRRGPKPVAFACRAAGIDRSVFSTVFTLSRRARALDPGLTTEERAGVDAIFASVSRKDAMVFIQSMIVS